MYSSTASRRCRPPVMSMRSGHSCRAPEIRLPAIKFARGARTGVLMIPIPAAAGTAPGHRGELGVRVTDEELEAAGVIFQGHHQAAGSPASPAGRAVIPARY